MKAHALFQSKGTRRRRGLTLLEVIITLTLHVIAFLGIFQMFNLALNTNNQAGQLSIATNLAKGLMTEIMMRDFVDPQITFIYSLGPNTGEVAGNRSTFDDVDDYNGYTDCPPKSLEGTAMDGTGGTPDYSDFSRRVDVVYCYIDGSNTIVPNGTDPVWPYKKLITVTVSAPDINPVSIVEIKADLPVTMRRLKFMKLYLEAIY